MTRLFTLAALSGILVVNIPAVHSQSDLRPAVKADDSLESWAGLPAAPRGKTTIFGGAIREFDPVRDRFMLNAVGERPMRVLFDERTQVFRDGKKIALRNLGLADHASVETTLDGSNVFAVSIHILSEPPEGEYQGKVLSYDPGRGVLSIQASASPTPFKVHLSADTQFARFGQPLFRAGASGPSDLAQGSLVSVKFHPQREGQAVATSITVLAVPGSTFAFSGNLVSIDLHSGLLEMVDPTDQKSYQISFSSALFPESRNFHPGDRVRVSARYNGTGFVATDVAAN